AGSYDKIHYFRMTQPVSRVQGILDVKAERVVLPKNGSYSTLGVVCARFKSFFFRYNCDRSAAGCFQGECETRDSAADDEIIELIFHCGFPILWSKLRCRILELRTSGIRHPTSLMIRRVQLILCIYSPLL